LGPSPCHPIPIPTPTGLLCALQTLDNAAAPEAQQQKQDQKQQHIVVHVGKHLTPRLPAHPSQAENQTKHSGKNIQLETKMNLPD